MRSCAGIGAALGKTTWLANLSVCSWAWVVSVQCVWLADRVDVPVMNRHGYGFMRQMTRGAGGLSSPCTHGEIDDIESVTQTLGSQLRSITSFVGTEVWFFRVFRYKSSQVL